MVCPDSPLTPIEYDPNAAAVDNDLFPVSIRAAAIRINYDLEAALAEIAAIENRHNPQ